MNKVNIPYQFIESITDQIGLWKPSHETLINCVIPCLTCTEDYVEKIVEFKSLKLEIVSEMYKNDIQTYETICREYLNQIQNDTLISMFNDIVLTESEINNTYPYQLLQFGIITPDNFNLLSTNDLLMISQAYSITHMKKENIIHHLIMNYKKILDKIQITHPQIMSNKIMISLWKQCLTYSKPKPKLNNGYHIGIVNKFKFH